MAIEPMDWTGAVTLDEYILSLFQKGETKTAEFQVLLRIYGRERFERLWKLFLERRKNLENPPQKR